MNQSSPFSCGTLSHSKHTSYQQGGVSPWHPHTQQVPHGGGEQTRNHLPAPLGAKHWAKVACAPYSFARARRHLGSSWFAPSLLPRWAQPGRILPRVGTHRPCFPPFQPGLGLPEGRSCSRAGEEEGGMDAFLAFLAAAPASCLCSAAGGTGPVPLLPLGGPRSAPHPGHSSWIHPGRRIWGQSIAEGFCF